MYLSGTHCFPVWGGRPYGTYVLTRRIGASKLDRECHRRCDMDEFKLSLKGDGITVERTIDRETALVILNCVLRKGEGAATDDSQRQQSLPPPSTHDEDAIKRVNRLTDLDADQRQPNKPISVREYVNKLEPKTNAQIILSIAQYLAAVENRERFKRDTIRPKFPAAGETVPKNFARDFQTAIDRGWIGEDPQNRDLFYVTRTGEAQIEKGFKGKRN